MEFMKKCFLFNKVIRSVFYIFSVNLLNLLLPLSFLLLSRLSRAQYLASSQPPPDSILLSLFLYTNPTILHILVSFVGIATLVNALTSGRVALPARLTSPIRHPRLYTTWILLCTLQVCVGLGVEGTLAVGMWTVDRDETSHGLGDTVFVVRVAFFVGLHETAAYWSRRFVRPVVDDTVFGCPREEKWGERLVMSACFGAVWWWRLRDEAEGLVLVGNVKRGLLLELGVCDIVSWSLYYLTVVVGLVRMVRGILWLGNFVMCRKPVAIDVHNENDDKV